jgi:hypothetical protein
MAITTVGPAAASGFSRAEILTSSGTWTHPDGASVGSPKSIYVILVGGGGGGAGGSCATPSSTTDAAMSGVAGGGASGVVNENFMTVTGSVTYTIGSGGAGGTGNSVTSSGSTNAGNSGGTGGTTFFGTLSAIGGGVMSEGYSYGPASALNGYISASGNNGGSVNPALGGSMGGATIANHVTGTSGARSPGQYSTPPNNGFPTSRTMPSIGYVLKTWGQANYYAMQSVSSIGNQWSPQSYYPFPKRTALVAGGGGEGAWGQTSSSNYTNTDVGSGANGWFGTGGAGGQQLFRTSGNVTGGNGVNGTGYGSGGGGGGSALGIGNVTVIGGTGGSGAAGAIIVLY